VSEYEAQLSKMVDTLSTASLKALLVEALANDPSLVLKGYRLAESEENMSEYFNQAVEKLNNEIARSLSVEVSVIQMVPGDSWWKDASQLESYRRKLESRESNPNLNLILKELSSFFVSGISICTQFLDKGNSKLAYHCCQLLINSYAASEATKDGHLSVDEEAAFVRALSSFHSSFALGTSTSPSMLRELSNLLTWLTNNLIHEHNKSTLHAHLTRVKV
jgi:hypothetical protein